LAYTDNSTIRKQRRIGAGLMAVVSIFFAVASTGMIFPNSGAPAKTIIQFEIGTDFSDGQNARIFGLADQALDEPTTIVYITGHTGADGDPEANARLSNARAEAVKAALVDAGVPQDRIQTRGAGGSVPVEAQENESPAAVKARTKRAEIRLVERSMTSIESSQ
jgi:preprotein translocase subunit SecF